MDLTKLFHMQRELDEHIEKEHPRTSTYESLAKKMIALQVELGECANEWRGFKFWSKDQEPRVKAKCSHCKGKGFHEFFDAFEMFESQYSTEPCEDCEGTGFNKHKNPLLEEYVDCLHFILSIGLELELKEIQIKPLDKEFRSVIEAFRHCFNWVVNLDYELLERDFPLAFRVERTYFNLISVFIELGRMLGFSWEQVEEAYFAKNAVNHERQENGY